MKNIYPEVMLFKERRASQVRPTEIEIYRFLLPHVYGVFQKLIPTTAVSPNHLFDMEQWLLWAHAHALRNVVTDWTPTPLLRPVFPRLSKGVHRYFHINIGLDHLSMIVKLSCVLWCFKNALFLRIQVLFFILCTDILKSLEKKFQPIWGSFDAPARQSFLIQKIRPLSIGNSIKQENWRLLFDLRCIFLPRSFFHGHGVMKQRSKAFHPFHSVA